MYDSGKIITGIAIFVVLFTFPFWFAMGKAAPAPESNLNTPAINQLTEKKCIEDTEYMRENHMKILNDWRETVVRDGNGIYVAKDGTEYEMSLQNTCLECHADTEDLITSSPTEDLLTEDAGFCFECHDYASVDPDCWECHLEEGGNLP